MSSNACQSFEDFDRGNLTIFQQDWWLKVARGSAPLKEVRVHGPNGAVIGSLSYIIQYNGLGIASGTSAHLSRVSGPVVDENLTDEETTDVVLRLIEQLPNISFAFSISEHAPNARVIGEAFKCAGFDRCEQINYSQPPADVTSRLGAKLREHIKQADKKLSVVSLDPDTFMSFYDDNLKAADNQRSYFPLDVARELIAASLSRAPPQALILAASRKEPEPPRETAAIDAAICIVWDRERCYYWLSTHRKDSHPDATKLLILAAMKHARNLGLVFDADGANTPGAQRLFQVIFRMPNEERRYIFTRASRWSQLYERHRSKIDTVRKFAISLGLHN